MEQVLPPLHTHEELVDKLLTTYPTATTYALAKRLAADQKWAFEKARSVIARVRKRRGTLMFDLVKVEKVEEDA